MGLELKRSAKAPATALQIFNLDRINESNGYGTLCYPENLEEVIAKLEEIANETKVPYITKPTSLQRLSSIDDGEDAP